MRFLEKNADDIEDEEKDVLLKEWREALSQLRGLVNGDALDKVVRNLEGHGVSRFGEWRSLDDIIFEDRGRGRHRLERYNLYMQGLSVPARRSALIDFSLLARIAYHSPLRSTFYDEVDAIHEHSHRLMLGLTNLGRHFDRVGHRY